MESENKNGIINKENLVHLDNVYGRKEKSYGGEYAIQREEGNILMFPKMNEESIHTINFQGLVLTPTKQII